MALSGRTITLNSVMRPSGSDAMMMSRELSTKFLANRLDLINDHLKMLLLRAGLGTLYVTSSAPAAATAGQPRTA